ncbi:MAG: ATP-binding protein [Oceanihabitans sp.]|nr:ATP-binding protein [Oceanihabitans sp.]
MGSPDKLIKVLIFAYTDRRFSTLSKVQPNPISLPVNPKEFSQKHRLTSNKTAISSYVVSNPKELKLDFILDGTNTIAGYTYNSDNHAVKEQLAVFMHTVYFKKASEKYPRFLKIKWGDSLAFSGILSDLNLNYTLFEPNGDPLRIEVSATFSSIPSTMKNAEVLHTDWNWEHLVLNDKTKEGLEDILDWIAYRAVFFKEWEMSNKIKPSYFALFHGPPGTGKTLTATLLGKKTNQSVYRVNLSRIISKYIGETEKNLIDVLRFAEKSNSILFFDEADALFGKRTEVGDAHDSYANQEVSYLLHVMENFNGILIFAVKDNIQDPIISQRFQVKVPFLLPNASERYELWQNAIPVNKKLQPKIDLKMLSEKYELSATEIMNVVRFASLKTIKEKEEMISNVLIVKGIRREYEKRN